jgi:hypothetical protein
LLAASLTSLKKKKKWKMLSFVNYVAVECLLLVVLVGNSKKSTLIKYPTDFYNSKDLSEGQEINPSSTSQSPMMGTFPIQQIS